MFSRIITIILLIISLTAQAALQPTSYKSSNNSVEIYFCGTGTPSSNKAIRHPSCLALIYDNELSLFDAGESTSIQLEKIGINLDMISRIFLTHLHSDHISGIGDVMIQSWIVGRDEPLSIYGPYGLEQVVRGINLTYQPDIWFRSINREGFLNPNVVSAKAHVIDVGKEKYKQVWTHKDLTVAAVPVHHEPVYPAFGYQITYNNCRVFITGDTRVFNEEPNIFKGNDAVISEAMSRPLMNEKSKREQSLTDSNIHELTAQIMRYHSDTIDLAKTAQQANIKRLFLTHLDPFIGESEQDKQDFTAGMDQYYKGSIVVVDDLDKIILKSDVDGACEVSYVPHK